MVLLNEFAVYSRTVFNKPSWPGLCASTQVVAFRGSVQGVVGCSDVIPSGSFHVGSTFRLTPFSACFACWFPMSGSMRPPTWLRGAGEVGCLNFLQTVPWAASAEQMQEYATWLVKNGADSLDTIAALEPASFAGSPIMQLHAPVMIRYASKAVEARDGASGGVLLGGGGAAPPPSNKNTNTMKKMGECDEKKIMTGVGFKSDITRVAVLFNGVRDGEYKKMHDDLTALCSGALPEDCATKVNSDVDMELCNVLINDLKVPQEMRDILEAEGVPEVSGITMVATWMHNFYGTDM